MKLAQLLSIFPQLRWGESVDQTVSSVTQDSRRVGPGVVFVAVRGSAADGHEYLKSAAKAGALALVVEDDRGIPSDFKGAVVKVESTRVALEKLAERWNGNPARDLFCIGVTGTNGKTTITYMIEAIFTRYGWPTGVIGTIDHHLGSEKWSSQLTTPDPLTLHKRLREFVDLGARAAAFEVSSHALDQHRADSLPFSVGVFTNFTRDHLDYHKTMEDYFVAKERLFRELLGRRKSTTAVLNGDDPWIRKTRVQEGVQTWWFGQDAADFTFRILKQDLNGSLFHVATPRGSAEIQLPCPGPHNVYNAVAALAAAMAAGVSLATAGEALAKFYGAPGRLEKVPNGRGLHIFVDYAHTDDALATVLKALSDVRASSNSAGRIVTVFGCGGDRDKGKRPLMARAAARFSDIAIVTSDNPRGENPETIIEEISAGFSDDWKGQKVIEIDRRQALQRALQIAREGDVILVAGKGHEDYQIVGQQRLPFSDQLELQKLLTN